MSINTYGGSLLIGATRRGDEIVASMEDANYGIPIQQANFPHLTYYPTQNDWPTMSLKDTMVISHPPCAAFSSQNRGHASQRGVDAPKVKCTAAVLHYAMGNQAPVVTVECVPKGLEGRRSLDDEFAAHYGYDVYRVMLNAALLGVPQFRPRFWAFFIRKDLLKNGQLNLTLPMRKKNVGDVVNEPNPGPLTDIPWVKKVTAQQLERLRSIMDGQEVGEYLATMKGSVVRTLPQYLKYDKGDELRAAYAMGHNFTSHSMVMLPDEALAPTLLAGSWWWSVSKGRALYAEEYKAIMDFPRDYIFPGDYYLNRCREYLSRGVAPATAIWVLDMVESNTSKERIYEGETCLQRSIRHGETADFRIQRKDAAREHQGRHGDSRHAGCVADA